MRAWASSAGDTGRLPGECPPQRAPAGLQRFRQGEVIGHVISATAEGSTDVHRKPLLRLPAPAWLRQVARWRVAPQRPGRWAALLPRHQPAGCFNRRDLGGLGKPPPQVQTENLPQPPGRIGNLTRPCDSAPGSGRGSTARKVIHRPARLKQHRPRLVNVMQHKGALAQAGDQAVEGGAIQAAIALSKPSSKRCLSCRFAAYRSSRCRRSPAPYNLHPPVLAGQQQTHAKSARLFEHAQDDHF